MKVIFLFSALLVLLTSGKFKDEQNRYPRVRAAYAEKEAGVELLLEEHDIQLDEIEIYLRAFKLEKEIELWVKNKSDASFKLIKTYAVCRTSGTLGPKRKEGDLQIPEGFYHIEAFNPASSYHLSMRINYPNASDRILGCQGSLGNNICIHGNCVTIGCLPITDDKIKELYLYCVEAKDKGQNSIPVTIYPARLSNAKLQALTTRYASETQKLNLWEDLKLTYDSFELSHQLPSITFLPNGRHRIK